MDKTITSLYMAEILNVEHDSIKFNIKKYYNDLMELGNLEKKKRGKKGTKGYKIWYELNKKQVSFLLSKSKCGDNRDLLAKELGIDFQVVGTRLENNFKDILQSIITGFSDELILESQVNFNGYLIDYVIYEKINNDKYICLLIEYDEKIHKYYELKDKIREENIMNYIFKNSDDEIVSIYRVKEGEELKAISDIIMFLTNEQALYVQNYEKFTDIKTYHRYNTDNLLSE